jgi:hypothetical protein
VVSDSEISAQDPDVGPDPQDWDLGERDDYLASHDPDEAEPDAEVLVEVDG